jgi:hypothetical protein
VRNGGSHFSVVFQPEKGSYPSKMHLLLGKDMVWSDSVTPYEKFFFGTYAEADEHRTNWFTTHQVSSYPKPDWPVKIILDGATGTYFVTDERVTPPIYLSEGLS